MSSSSRVIAGPAGELQACLECRAATPAFTALVAHPHPLHGGTMDTAGKQHEAFVFDGAFPLIEAFFGQKFGRLVLK